MLITPEQLTHEERIVWEEDINRLPYVRASLETVGRRRKGIQWHAGRRVGYAELRADAPNNGDPRMFERRVFWLKAHDRDSDPTGCYATGSPIEAVDTRTVAPGVPGTAP